MTFNHCLRPLAGLGASLPALLLWGATPAQAMQITFEAGSTTSVISIEDLEVDGTLYDVVFESGSYNSVYSGSFDFTVRATARSAADALAAALSESFTTLGITTVVDYSIFESSRNGDSDGFLIPYGTGQSSSFVAGFRDSDDSLPTANDNIVQTGAIAKSTVRGRSGSGTFRNASWARFTEAPQEIPTPALLPGLLGFGAGMIRKRRKLAQSEYQQNVK